MNSKKSQSKKEPKKSYSIRYSKDLEAMLLEIYDIEGMLPLHVKLPQLGVRKIVKTKNGVQMV